MVGCALWFGVWDGRCLLVLGCVGGVVMGFVGMVMWFVFVVWLVAMRGVCAGTAGNITMAFLAASFASCAFASST